MNNYNKKYNQQSVCPYTFVSIFSLICFSFSLDVPEARYIFFLSIKDVYDTFIVSILFYFSLTPESFNVRVVQNQLSLFMSQSLFSQGRSRRSFQQLFSSNYSLTLYEDTATVFSWFSHLYVPLQH